MSVPSLPLDAVRHRAYRLALDPSPAQIEVLERYTTASRCAFNFALGIKAKAHAEWQRGRDALVDGGMDRAEANKKAPKVRMPSKQGKEFENGTYKQFIVYRKSVDAEPRMIGPYLDGEKEREHFRWWLGVNSYCYQEAFVDADAAFRNWLDSVAGRRPPMGYPRFKRRGSRASCRLYGAVALVDYRHIRVPGGNGQEALRIRLHEPARELGRKIARGTVVLKHITLAREGARWFAALSVEESTSLAPTTRRQRAAGRVGVDLGVAHMATLTTPLEFNGVEGIHLPNPRYLELSAKKLRRAKREMSRRYVKGARSQSKGYLEAKARVAKLSALVAQQRASAQHLLTKRLVTSFGEVAIEDLRVRSMTKSAKGSAEKPGVNVRAKAGLNRSLLDIGPAEIRRQLHYKAGWLGSSILLAPPAYTSIDCHVCHHRDSRNRVSQALFVCRNPDCGWTGNADYNAAMNIRFRAE